MSDRRRVWLYGCGAAVLLGLLVWALAPTGGHHVRLWLSVALPLGLALIALPLGELWSRAPAGLPDVATSTRPGASDRETGGLLRTQRQLERAGQDADRAEQVQTRLRTLTEYRLRAAGIDLRADPAAARELLGDEVWTLLTAQQPRLLPPRTIDAWLTTLERL